MFFFGQFKNEWCRKRNENVKEEKKGLTKEFNGVQKIILENTKAVKTVSFNRILYNLGLLNIFKKINHWFEMFFKDFNGKKHMAMSNDLLYQNTS